MASGAYYLGRPWSEYARVVFQSTSMTDVINSAGWSEWSTTEPNTEDVYFVSNLPSQTAGPAATSNHHCRKDSPAKAGGPKLEVENVLTHRRGNTTTRVLELLGQEHLSLPS